MDSWRYAYINPTILYTHIQYHGHGRLCQLCKYFVVAVHPLYRTHLINDAGSWSSDTFCRIYIFLKLRGKCGFVCTYGPICICQCPCKWAQWVAGARTSFIFTLLLSATRIIWLKRFRSALRTTFWRFIRDVFVLFVLERFQSLLRRLVVEFH